MESGITIELEQSFASVVRYIQNKADNNAALYFDDLPEAFAVPSLYFPVPRTDTRKVTFSTYLTTLYLDTWFMEATDWQAYADAATVRDSLMMDECKVNLMKKDGTLDDKYIRLTDPSTSPVDTGIVKMTCAIKHYYSLNRETGGAVNKINISGLFGTDATYQAWYKATEELRKEQEVQQQMSTRRIEQAVVEPAETVKQETKFRVDKLRAKCMQLFHVTSSTFDGAMYGCTATEMTISEAQARIDKWLGKE